MNITAYFRYRWKAHNRHGVHSPFAYAFVEDVIEDRKRTTLSDIAIPWTHKPALRYDRLLRRMMAYYGYKSIINLTTGDNKINAVYDVLLIDSDKSAEWLQMLNNNKELIGNDSALVLAGIHNTKSHSEAWQKVCAAPMVRMSIDLYDIGLLFFKKEFIVPQRFVFKGPE